MRERLFDKLSDKKDDLITLRDCCEELGDFVENQYKNYQVIKSLIAETIITRSIFRIQKLYQSKN